MPAELKQHFSFFQMGAAAEEMTWYLVRLGDNHRKQTEIIKQEEVIALQHLQKETKQCEILLQLRFAAGPPKYKADTSHLC